MGLFFCSMCSGPKPEGQKYIDDYFNSLSILTNTKIIDKEKLITMSPDTLEQLKTEYITTNDRRFENTHHDIWNLAPNVVFHNNYRFLAWSIVFLSNLPNKLKVDYINYIEKLPESNKLMAKEEIFTFLNSYLNFISSFAASMLNEKVKKTSPEDLENCHKYFDKKIRDQYLSVLLKPWEHDDNIDLLKLLNTIDNHEEIRSQMQKLYYKHEAF